MAGAPAPYCYIQLHQHTDSGDLPWSRTSMFSSHKLKQVSGDFSGVTSSLRWSSSVKNRRTMASEAFYLRTGLCMVTRHRTARWTLTSSFGRSFLARHAMAAAGSWLAEAKI